jgi:hypothetical protein
LRLSAVVAVLIAATALTARADDVTRLQWGGSSTSTPAKKTSGGSALKFVKPSVGGSSSSNSDSNSSRSNAHIKLAAWDSNDAPQLTSGRETDSRTRSVVVNRDDNSSEGVRSAQLPPANSNSSGNKNSKVEDSLRSPFTDNAEPNPLPMPGENTNPGLPAPEGGSLQLNQQQQTPQPSNQFQPVLPSGPSADQSPPSPAANDTSLKTDSVKAKESCDKSLQNLREYTVNKVKLDIAIKGTEGEDYPFECSIDDGSTHVGRCWEQTTYMWKASAMCHKPLYFEDEQLERYGHSFSPCIQPFVSGAHFFLTVPVLPYCMGVEPPGECVYALGHYRPGDCAPYMCDPIPLSLRGALFEGGAVVGVAAAIP